MKMSASDLCGELVAIAGDAPADRHHSVLLARPGKGQTRAPAPVQKTLAIMCSTCAHVDGIGRTDHELHLFAMTSLLARCEMCERTRVSRNPCECSTQ